MADPLSQLALAQAVSLSAEIEVQLTHRKLRPDRRQQLSPLMAALVKMRRQAAQAIAELVTVQAVNTHKVSDLQNEVRMFVEFCESLRQIVDAGFDATEAIDGGAIDAAEIENAQALIMPHEHIENLQDMGLSPKRRRRTED